MSGKKIYLVLHNIRSLHNVGSIFRTADAFGVTKIFLTGITPSPYDVFNKLRQDFAKTALGAEKYVEWEKVKNITSLFKRLREEKILILSLENRVHGSVTINRFFGFTKKASSYNKNGGIALILGNEVRGIPKSILEKSDAVLEVPMFGKKESLNVSVAAGVALYEVSKSLDFFTTHFHNRISKRNHA